MVCKEALILNLGGIGDNPEVTIKPVTYMDFVKMTNSFIALDISVNSTGWARWRDNQLEYGVYKLQTPKDDEVGRRREFRAFLRDLFGDYSYDYLFVEDVIGGVNFQTNKILYQLNPIADDMIDDGVIHAKEIIREDNKVWKSMLKKCANYKSDIRAPKDDKQVTREALFLLGFGDKTTNTIAEDIYDAIGMSVGIIFKKFVLKGMKAGRRLRKDITRGYQIHQFEEYYDALDYANEVGGYIHDIDFMNIRRDLKSNFKSLIDELGDDTGTFVISILTAKIGVLALQKDLNLDQEVSYLVVYRKNRKI